MNDKFVLLDCDDDVILFEKDTFKVSRLKELLSQDIDKKLNQRTYNSETKSPSDSMMSVLSPVAIGEYDKIYFNEFQFHSVKNCQVLRIGGKGWQKGKLKIIICREPYNKKQAQVCLEFCPEEPESPLEELRQMINNL